MPQKGGNHKHHGGGDCVEIDHHSSGHTEMEVNGKHHHHHVHSKDYHYGKGANGGGESKDPNITKCCVPTGCNLNQPIRMEDLNDCVKVICNNDNCNQGRYMHKSCFESWEDSVLTFLRSTGRARSWSEKQRLQNLWTKKGYDLAYKACGCKCGKGHLRKDLDWTAPVSTSSDETGKKKKNRKKKANDKPSLIISTSMSTCNGSSASSNNNSKTHVPISTGNINLISGSSNMNSSGPISSSPPSSSTNVSVLPISRFRTSSMSSSGSAGSGGTSPPGSGSESLSSPGFFDQSAFMKKFFGAADHNQQQSSSTTNASTISQPNHHPHYHHHHQSHHHFHHDNTGRRERRGSGSIFSRRQDYSSFNNLPRHKINSYHIKMEDDHGNDDTRNFILSTLSANRMNRISCIMCHTSMMIFDKYPLIDGTFFLSPTQHSKGAVLTTVENGSKQYLNAVCMGCLEGWNSILKCRSCSSRWTGSHLILGSMYSYDIFAAVPCCTDRLRCNNCKNLVISPDHRLQFFSHYSNSIACGHCGIVDFHFAKPLQVNFIRTGRE